MRHLTAVASAFPLARTGIASCGGFATRRATKPSEKRAQMQQQSCSTLASSTTTTTSSCRTFQKSGLVRRNAKEFSFILLTITVQRRLQRAATRRCLRAREIFKQHFAQVDYGESSKQRRAACWQQTRRECRQSGGQEAQSERQGVVERLKRDACAKH